ncbi:MAG: mannitol dehydrogenase family protein, partial [Hyphomicrobiaceae bacterium]
SDAPRTVFGCLLTALRRRREAGVAPFTVMSCDNIPENGKLTRTITCRLAQAQSSNFSNWVAANVAFPNSMVDCITPAVSERERHFVQKRFGIADPRPVVCEPYRQWVLEDNFPNGRPALERVGVEFVADVTSYELMKLRILNGGHAAIAYPAAVLGIHQVHEAMQHPAILAYLRKLVGEEIIPTLPAVADVDFHQYFETVCGRFLNSAVADTIERLCIDGSSRQPKFVLPTIQSRLEAGESIDGLALELALWCRYCAGVDQEGTAITIVDVNAEALTQHAQRARTDPDAFLELEMVFGSLGKAPALRRAFSSALETVWKTGVANTLRNYTRCSA